MLGRSPGSVLGGYSLDPAIRLLDIAVGYAPKVKRRQGRHAMAASFVLRTFAGCFVAALPTDAACERIALSHPDVRVEGRDRSELLQKYEDCRRDLGITLLRIRSELAAAEQLIAGPFCTAGA